MKTKNEIFHIQCGMLDAFDMMAHNLRERRRETLDEMCEFMNEIFVGDIEEGGIQNAHFSIDDFECEPDLVLRFEEKYSRKDFKTEEEWMEYQSNHIKKCYDYFKEIHSALHLVCLPVDENET